ncbi:MAG: DNA-directed RNA polymerase, subunit E [archaeon GW2011_AR20]|nr:MAG: DNA-directed RNA polymerase, subunit E [archaeon GW2011_AR20]MBS3160789.1 DNA-directed RNA polymerase subunit E'' [Candidatus Woesearchaeota archaeon]
MKKVCRKCKIFVDKEVCPICGGNQFTNTWKGRIAILNSEKSEIAKKLEIKKDGEYAIKIR